MLALLMSPNALIFNGVVNPAGVQTLKNICGTGTFVGLTSNRIKPAWFDQAFAGSSVQFIKTDVRQNGVVVREIAKQLNIATFDVLVLAIKSEDMQMAKNGRALLIAAGWTSDQVVRNLGVSIASGAELYDLLKIVGGWRGHWWFEGSGKNYSASALADLSGYGINITQSQQKFASKLTQAVKNGGTQLTALLLATSRSLLMDGIYSTEQLCWGVYPSSKSQNNDTEVLSDFTHRLRTTVSQVRFCKRNEPLFIRHTHSDKRSANRNSDRTDPKNQVETLHINPEYMGKLRGRNIIVIDDCTTHGLSFGVAAAFLRAAGAASVKGVALGKFGSTLKYFDIQITSDPYRPVNSAGYIMHSHSLFNGVNDLNAQQTLISLLI